MIISSIGKVGVCDKGAIYLVMRKSSTPNTIFEFRSKFNGRLMASHEIKTPIGFFNTDKFYIVRYNDSYLKIEKESFILTKYESHVYPFKFLKQSIVSLDQLNSKFIFKTPEGEIINKWEQNLNVNTYFFEDVILEFCFRSSEQRWLRGIDIYTGEEIWKRNYLGEIGSPSVISDRIFMYTANEYLDDKRPIENQNLSFVTKGIDVSNGNRIWRLEGLGSNHFNRDKSKFYINHSFSDEYNSRTGELTNRVKMVPNLPLTEIVDGDDKAYYFKNRQRFGKINKVTGNIEWFFIFKNDNGHQMDVTDVILLDNGNFILGLKNGKLSEYFMALFDPLENLEHSYIINGEIVKEFRR